MSISIVALEEGCRLVFGADLTFDFVRELEDAIIDALRRYAYIEIDLAGVTRIDACGIHLLGLLLDFGGGRAKIASNMQLVEQAYARFFSSQRGDCLRGSRDERKACRGDEDDD